MTVYDLLSSVDEDERLRELNAPMNVLAQHFPDVFTGTYDGPPGEELDAVERELEHIQRIDDEATRLDADLPALEVAAEEERRRIRGRWVLVGMLLAVALLILVVMGML